MGLGLAFFINGSPEGSKPSSDSALSPLCTLTEEGVGPKTRVVDLRVLVVEEEAAVMAGGGASSSIISPEEVHQSHPTHNKSVPPVLIFKPTDQLQASTHPD
jgi:hypothetical protein